MDNEKTPSTPPGKEPEARQEAREAREGDAALNKYDKEVADSFPASDPPAMP